MSKPNYRNGDTHFLDWAKIYNLFDNKDFYQNGDEAHIFQKTKNNNIYVIVACSTILPHKDMVRWIISHTYITLNTINDDHGISITLWKPYNFARIYALKPLQVMLNITLAQDYEKKFDFIQLVRN